MAAVDAITQDVKGAVRGLWKSPGFAAASLITLALGIGATSAIFSVVKAVLLTPLPYSAPEQRAMIWSKWISFDKTWLSDAGALRLSAVQQDHDGDRRLVERAAEPHRRRRAGARRRRVRDRERVRRARIDADAGAGVFGCGRPSQRSAGGAARVPALAGSLRRRSDGRGSQDPAERRLGRSDRRHAEWLPAADRLHCRRRRADATVATAPD